ncbi:YqzK family protein [Peribacillus sp. SCS-155]|uniref:YqzK family protein n=1 Tax=Peribacillus sedimenti TaxID=3115297 RepID=UPI003905F584
MKSSIKLIAQTAKVLILFICFTVLFYIGMIWLNEEYQDYHRYDQPKGTAVKVTKSVETDGTAWFNRLMLFYTNGE